MAVQLGRFAQAQQVIAHVSDTHLLSGGRRLGGVADTVVALERTAERLAGMGDRLDAIVVTGDVADLGEPDAYDRVRTVLEPVAESAGARLVWVMGNHDERAPFRAALIGSTPDAATSERGQSLDAPVNHVVDVDGLRLVAIDSTVPGYHHGDLEPETLEWLEQVLAEPAERGTILALHHAPIPTPVAIMDVLELRRQDELAAIVRDRDVRLILGGHLHYPTTGSFAGIPVSVAGAAAYTIDPSASPRTLVGIDGGRSFTLVHLFEDAVTTSVVPIDAHPVVSRIDAGMLAELEASTPEQRLERFSRKPPT
ncbi:3',5'-cyclic AMP phosphodiesterase CpdA [Agromyces terreus]|uniref:3',5'-cyclic AMP phosphodiesterase CpdA n=1 Tax=Agromyces terreus TaxID=424795 RepID=A0A9X2GZW5_9MICO|nr:phosphodiesterase [Agromyces terreus]MCP2372210.1 3',5'-cyclic AMP phosphodiesterase CpdA [Agromyces terreus]